jgi:hypothetical protein
MRTRSTGGVLGIAALVVVFETGHAAARAPVVGAWQARASFGYASHSLDEWNDALETERRAFGAGAVYGSEFGSGAPFALEAAARRGAWALGAGYLHERAASSQLGLLEGGTYSRTSRVSMKATIAIVTWYPARIRGIHARAEGGVAWARASTLAELDGFFGDTASYNEAGSWTGTAPVFGIAVGYQRTDFNPGPVVFAQAGYRRQDFGALDGWWHRTGVGMRDGPPQDADGRTIETDLSGFHVVLGLGVQFGPRVAP